MKIELLPWDSEKFGYAVGRVNLGKEPLTKDLYSKLEKFQLVYLFTDKPLKDLKCTIKLVDVKVVWARNINQFEQVVRKDESLNYSITHFRGKVNNDLIELAFQSGKYSRFFTDKRLTNHEFEVLYTIWISQSAESGQIFLAIFQGETIGFISYRLMENFLKVDLIAVNDKFHGKGIGRALIYQVECVGKENSLMEVRIPTQELNIRAMSFYKALGYTIMRKSYIYHYWRE